MSMNHVQVGVDFSQKRVELCLLAPDGQVLVKHRAFGNSRSGFAQAKQLVLETLQTHPCDGLDVSGEATSYYWLPFFLHADADPDLKQQALNLFLLNPRAVRWFKKCFSDDNKTDPQDAFYIAERTRSHRPAHPWVPALEWLALRFYTRLRFHLAQALTREKNYFSAYLFLKCSAYSAIHPFADTFGMTSGFILNDTPTLAELVALPEAELVERLIALSRNRLPDPAANAHKLQRVADESFPVTPELAAAVQQVLRETWEHIRFLEAQIQQVQTWIDAEVAAHHPEVQYLMRVPGVGPFHAAGVAAEIGGLARFLEGTKWDPRRKRNRPKNLRDVEDAIAKFAGLWWPRADSGEFEAEERRLSRKGNRYLRYYLIEAADGLRQHVPEYQTFYQRKFREVNKHQHKRALVLTARKSVGLYVGLLHRQEAYHSPETT